MIDIPYLVATCATLTTSSLVRSPFWVINSHLSSSTCLQRKNAMLHNTVAITTIITIVCLLNASGFTPGMYLSVTCFDPSISTSPQMFCFSRPTLCSPVRTVRSTLKKFNPKYHETTEIAHKMWRFASGAAMGYNAILLFVIIRYFKSCITNKVNYATISPLTIFF